MRVKNFRLALKGLPPALALALLSLASAATADPKASGNGGVATSPAPTTRHAHKIVREAGNSCRTAMPGCSVNFDSDVTAGNVLIVFVDTMTSSGINSIVDTCNSAWRRDDNLFNTQFFRVFSATAACSGPETVTVRTNGSPDTEFQVLEVSGITQTLDGVAVRNPSVATNNSNNPVCDSITTTNADDLVLCAVGCQTPVSVASGPTDSGADASRWEESAAEQRTVDTLVVSHEDETATGTYGAQYTLGDITSWAALTIAYKDASGAIPTATATPTSTPGAMPGRPDGISR